MNPAFNSLDILHIVPYGDKEIMVGDVIVFNSPDRKKIVVHRIVSIDNNEIKTKGDNNPRIDDCTISPENILGLVDYYQTAKGEKRLSDGNNGKKLFFKIKKSTHRISRTGISIFRKPYLWLSHTGVLRGIFPLRSRLRILSFSKPGGTELQLLLGNRIIGKLIPGKNHWQIRRPYRLFIDTSALP